MKNKLNLFLLLLLFAIAGFAQPGKQVSTTLAIETIPNSLVSQIALAVETKSTVSKQFNINGND